MSKNRLLLGIFVAAVVVGAIILTTGGILLEGFILVVG
jgi:hypothetical protein